MSWNTWGWILIMTLNTPTGAAISTTVNLNSEKACNKAGEKWVESVHAADPSLEAIPVCVEKGPK